jgi:ribonuclease HI
LLKQESFVLGEMTPYAAEGETVLRAIDIASGITRGSVEVWSDSEALVRHMNGDYLLKAKDSKHYFDEIKKREQRFSGVTYFHHSREVELAKSAHTAAAAVYAKHHTRSK